MNIETKTIRLPKSEYEGKNAFLPELTDPAHIKEENLEDALERHRRFEFFLEYQKRAVPDFETMEAEVDREDDQASFKKQIEDLQASHNEDLQRLYDMDANEYAESIRRQYLSRDYTSQQSHICEAEERATSDLFESERRGLRVNWTDRYEQLRYGYLAKLISLTSDKNQAAIEQEQRRILLEKAFPMTKDDFNSKPQEFKLRIAKFLVADKVWQERYLDEFGWAWRQVQPLCDIFKQDAVFSSNIRAMVLNYKQNATTSQNQNVATNQRYMATTDPRKRPPAA